MEIERTELLDILKKVRPGLASNDDVEQSVCFVFSGDRVFTYNDEVAVSHPIPEGLSGAVQAKELYKYLSKVKQKVLQIETNKKELLVIRKDEDAGVKLEKEIKIPLKELDLDDSGWFSLPKGFSQALSFVLFSASKDANKPPVLMCVHVTPDFVETCDNFRMTRHTLDAKGDSGSEFLIFGSAAREMIKYDPIKVQVKKAWAHFKDKNDTVFSCRVFDNKYPDLTQFFEKQKGTTKITFPDKMKEVLEKAAIFVEGNKEDTRTVTIKVEEGNIRVEGRGDKGWYRKRLDSKYTGDAFEVIADPIFLGQILPISQDIEIGRVLKFKGENFTHVMSRKKV
jgi:DNA polymerase III sliding clamp (beta) subunit (PCNA family)